MRTENQDIPCWARRERQGDLGWLSENIASFRLVATASYAESGRGAIVVDTTSQPIPGAGHPFAYFPQEEIEESGDEDTKRLVRQYDPATDFVVMLLKPLNRTSSYQLRMQETGTLGDQLII
jgi:hypothetical protein